MNCNLFFRSTVDPEVKKIHYTCRHRHTSHQCLKSCSTKCLKENANFLNKSGSLDSCFTNNANERPLDNCELSVEDYKAVSECIRIGMTKASCYNNSFVVEPVESSKIVDEGISSSHGVENRETPKEGGFLAAYSSSKDELASYDVENSPYHFSLRSSLSDLTVDGSIAGIKRYYVVIKLYLECFLIMVSYL